MAYRDWDSIVEIKHMTGKVFTSIRGTIDGHELIFENDTERYVFFHYQECCENVSIKDIVGDLADLLGEPLLIAEEVSGEIPEQNDEEYIESQTWTFYKFATRRGYVDVCWLGESNGYYSESVCLGYELVDKTI
jgi:hypothetical protein